MSVHGLMRPFASAIFAKAAAYRHLRSALAPPQEQQFLKSLRDDVRRASNLHPHDVTEAAAAEGLRRGIADLSVKTRDDQPAFDPGRKAFIVEHMVPITAVVYDCLHCPDEERVLNELTTRLRVVWLLRSNARDLTLLGLRRKLPNPEEAYRRAGVRVLAKRRGDA